MIREHIGTDWVLAEVLEKLHAPLHVGAAADVGTAHLLILRSDYELLEACYVDRADEVREETLIGREFNRVHDADTVHWWINRNAQRAPQIGEHTLRTAGGAVALKRAAAALQFPRDSTYPQVIDRLARFCSDHAGTITEIRDYVEWLRSIDPFAPSMLFTTRVWSASGRIDRRPGPLRDFDNSVPPELMLWVSCEAALGVWGRSAPWAEQLFPSEGASESYVAALLGEPSDSEERGYVDEVKDRVIRGFREYFSDLRKAIENVSMECNAILGRPILAGDVAFWRMVIGELRESDRTETETWDIKRTLEFWGLHGEARALAALKFCRRVAAFANTSGGAVIIGLSEGDGLRVTGLTDVGPKIENTRHEIERYTTLNPQQVRIVPVPIDQDAEAETTCLVISVPSTMEPIKVGGPDPALNWPIRVDSRTRYSTEEEVRARKQNLAADDYSFTDELHRAFRGEDGRRLLSDY